ncbi:MAG: DUF485 domain-containing protein [Cellulomonadaceae bacterium]
MSNDAGEHNEPRAPGEISPEVFVAAQESEDFVRLRKRFRAFAFPMTAAFLIWYFSYVLLSTYAGDFMSTPLIGMLNVGLVMGLGQFLTTFLITWAYVRHANRNLDPVAAHLREELEASV